MGCGQNLQPTKGIRHSIVRTSALRSAEEKAKGTEFIAIPGWLEEWTWCAKECLAETRGAGQKRIAREKRSAGARLRSGA